MEGITGLSRAPARIQYTATLISSLRSLRLERSGCKKFLRDGEGALPGSELMVGVLLHGRDGHYGDPLASSDGAQAFHGGGLYRDLINGDSQHRGEAFPHP